MFRDGTSKGPGQILRELKLKYFIHWQSLIGKLFELFSTSWFEILFELVSTSTQIFSGLVGLVLFSTETGSKLVEKKLFSTKILRNISWDWFKNIEPVFYIRFFNVVIVPEVATNEIPLTILY